jgi:hypothetical protein
LSELPANAVRTSGAAAFFHDYCAAQTFAPRVSSILVPVELTRAGEALIGHAAHVANGFGARLVGVSASWVCLTEGVEQEAADRVARAARGRFARLSREVNAVCAWNDGNGPLTAALGAWAWAADLVIVSRKRTIGWPLWRLELEEVVARTRCPLLIRDGSVAWSPQDSVVVLWENTAAGRRALTAALPFLARASSVTLLAPPWRQSAEQERALADAQRGLLSRGISLHVVRRDRGPPAEVILDHIKRLDPGLVTMAAWSKTVLFPPRNPIPSIFAGLTGNVLLG